MFVLLEVIAMNLGPNDRTNRSLIRNGLFPIATAFFLAFICVGCLEDRGPDFIIVLPDEYEGLVKVTQNEDSQIEVDWDAAEWTLNVPNDGIIRLPTGGSRYINIIRARYKNGTAIPYDDDVGVKPDDVALYYVNTDDTSSIYFVGDLEGFDNLELPKYAP